MPRIFGNFARRALQWAKRQPQFRRWLSSRRVAPWMAKAAHWFPPSDTAYEAWIARRLEQRRDAYPTRPEANLLSLITPVWNTPPQYLRELAESVRRQVGAQPFEWIIVDNGSTEPATIALLQEIQAADPRVRLFHSKTNLGIVGGMRYCLEQAQGRYVVAVDHDDRLDDDALQIVTHFLQRNNYPPLLYSDEDHLCGESRLLPYCKPDWDPVLFLNSAYTAHLGVMDRRLALELDLYSDPATNSCPDWDAFLRFYAAGHTPTHIPEIIYSWRMHPGSTAANMHSKSDVASSHRAMLKRYLRENRLDDRFEPVPSPLFPGTPDWRLRRLPIAPRPALLVFLTDQHTQPSTNRTVPTGGYPLTETITLPRQAHPGILAETVEKIAQTDGMVAVIDQRIQLDRADWLWEALGLCERFPETAVVGGRLLNQRRKIIEAGRYFTKSGRTASPDQGRHEDDPGYFHQLWKQRSVDGVSPLLAVYSAEFLDSFLQQRRDLSLSFETMQHAIATHAADYERRVIYTPFLTGRISGRLNAFDDSHSDDAIHSRYYSKSLTATVTNAYKLAASDQTAKHAEESL